MPLTPEICTCPHLTAGAPHQPHCITRYQEWNLTDSHKASIRCALGVSTHARPQSSHVVAQEEVLPAIHALTGTARPPITVLCGSTRFYPQFQEANRRLTMQGRIVLSIGFYPHSAEQAHGESVGITRAEKAALDALHRRKIDLADDVLVLDLDGYIGDSTRSEIEYATALGKPIRYLSAEFAVVCTCGWSGADWPDAKDHIVDTKGEHTVTRATNAAALAPARQDA